MNEIRIEIEGLKELTEAVRTLAAAGGRAAAPAATPGMKRSRTRRRQTCRHLRKCANLHQKCRP